MAANAETKLAGAARSTAVLSVRGRKDLDCSFRSARGVAVAVEFVGKPYGEGPKGAWAFLALSKQTSKALGTRGSAPIRVTVNGSHEARRPETREKRVREAIARFTRGGKFWD